jgi:hypothetical protein
VSLAGWLVGALLYAADRRRRNALLPDLWLRGARRPIVDALAGVFAHRTSRQISWTGGSIPHSTGNIRPTIRAEFGPKLPAANFFE